jgi:hypothetical protein
MKNKYFSAIKLLVLLSIFPFLSQAQTTHTIGTGTVQNSYTGFPTPFGDWNEGSRMQYLYLASDLQAAGMQPGRITAIKFDVVSINPSTATPPVVSGVHENYTIAVGSTTTGSLSTTSWEPGTSVVWGPMNYSPTVGINTFTLTTPFVWDGTSNIIVEICHGDASALTSTIYTRNATVNSTTVSYNAQHTYAADAIATGCGATATTQKGTATTRPNIIFDIISCPEVIGLNVTNLKSTSATIGWTPVPSSAGYEYVLSTTATAPTGSGTPTTATSYNATGLTPSTIYYLHVRNKCSVTSSSIWKTISFTTPNDCPAPANVQVNITGVTTADINWDAIAGTEGYEYVVNNTATPPAGTGTAVASNNVSISGLAPNTLYYIHLRNNCTAPIAAGKSDWISVAFTTPECRPTTSIDIVNITPNTADLVWNQVAGANRYTYVVNNTPGTPMTAEELRTNSFIVNLKNLRPGTKYYVHVRSECYINDKSGWQLDSFVTQGQCDAPDVQVAKNGTDSFSAKWTALANDYSYEYAIRESNQTPVSGIQVYQPNTSVVLPNDNKAYYLHVRRKCDVTMEYSNWTTMLLRRANTTGIAGKEITQVKVYPNPVKDKLMIEVSGNQGKNAQAVLTSLSGQVLGNITINGATTELDMASYPAGIYFIKYTDSNSTEIIKISKQ